MSTDTTPYPDPHVTVDDYTDIAVGDVIRYTTRNPAGALSDGNDYVVRAVETDPRDFADGTKFAFPCHRLHVVALVPPAESAASRTFGDVSIEYSTTRIVDASDKIVRADKRYTGKLVEYVIAQGTRLP